MTMSANDQNLRILVIDDNQTIHEDFRRTLQAKDEDKNLDQARAALFGDTPRVRELDRFELDCVYQGRAALTLVQRARKEGRSYAMAFVDMRLPPGWERAKSSSVKPRASSTAMASASPMASAAVVLAVGARLSGQASCATRASR